MNFNNLLLFILSFSRCTLLAQSVQQPRVITVKINPDIKHQTIDGFGASDAWRCQFIGENYPDEKKEQLADWLFSQEFDDSENPKGIGLSIWRTELGAGSTEQGDSSGIKNVWRRAESYLNADGSYDWERNKGQRWFLHAAQKRGVEQFVAFTNSPPVHYTLNGKSFADKGISSYNLKEENYAKMASYLANVVQHYKEEGIKINYISPVNEPQWTWDNGNQEGSPAQNEDIYKITVAISEEFASRKIETQLTVGEAGQLNYLFGKVKPNSPDNQIEAFWSPSSPYYLGNFSNVKKVISGHSYFTTWPIKKQIETRKKLRNQILKVDPKLTYWMSEFCILEKNEETGQGSGRDLSMATALYYARVIHNDLTVANAASWQYWTAVSNHDYKDGLVYVDLGNDGINGINHPDAFPLMKDGYVRSSKSLWAFGNFARFVRPEFQRIDCQGSTNELMISAYKNTTKDEVIIVAVNTSDEDLVVHSNAKNLDIKQKYVTDATNELTSQKSLDSVCPRKSVVTFVVAM
ncbi:MAG: O-glycosyl hydrolase [Oceanospirillaceae bacterium]|jgi:O-glycosyl hydrolase